MLQSTGPACSVLAGRGIPTLVLAGRGIPTLVQAGRGIPTLGPGTARGTNQLHNRDAMLHSDNSSL